MLAIDFLEFLRGRLRILTLVHEVQALIIELVGRLLDEGIVLGEELVPQRSGAGHEINAIAAAIFPVPVALVVQPRAYGPHKSTLTNRIRRYFARIKAAGTHRYQLWLLRETAHGRRLKTFRRRQKAAQGASKTMLRRRPRGRSGHIEGDVQETSKRTLRKRRGRRPGRSCRPPCRFRPRRGRANGAPFRPRSPARRCDRPSRPSEPHD